MDLNLSKICDMLAERIEEYKSTSKKRRIERGMPMYASTPIETPKYQIMKPFTTVSAMLSTITKSPSQETPRRHRKRKLSAKRLAYDCVEKDEVDDNFKVEPSYSSLARFPLSTKLSRKNLCKRRILQRENFNVRRLSFADEECKDVIDNLATNCEITLKQSLLDLSNDMFTRHQSNHEENEKCVRSFLKERLDQTQQSPLDTFSKIKAKRLYFDFEEDQHIEDIEYIDTMFTQNVID